MLARNKTSIAGQTSTDWVQTLLIDEVGRGVGWSYGNMGRYAPNIVGRYVWILDDDDECICRTLVDDLRRIVEEHDPDVIMMRMDHGPRGILPDSRHWQAAIELGFIGVSAIVVRRELWQKYAPVMAGEKYSSDFDFIQAILADTQRVVWHDCIASRVQQISMGAPEA